MVNARTRNAPRKGIIAILVALSGSATPALAGDSPQLLLPLVAALSLGSSAVQYAAGIQSSSPSLFMRMLPPQLRVPTMEISPVKARHVPDYVTAVDNDLIVGLDLLPHRRNGWMLSLHLDDETRVPLPAGSNLISVIAEYKF